MKAGYGILLETSVIKTGVYSVMQVPLFSCVFLWPFRGTSAKCSVPGIPLS